MTQPAYRAAGVALATQGVNFYTQGRAAAEAAQCVDQAILRAMTLASSFQVTAFVDAVIAEARRRGDVMGAAQGWDSVADDLAAGRWTP